MPANPAVVKFHADATAVLAGLNASADGLVIDVAALKQTIVDLNNRPVGWGQEDQDLVDKALSQLGALATKVKALDDATENLPPLPPNEPA